MHIYIYKCMYTEWMGHFYENIFLHVWCTMTVWRAPFTGEVSWKPKIWLQTGAAAPCRRHPMVRARRASLCICFSTFLGVQLSNLLSFSWAFCGAWHPNFRPAPSQCVQCTGQRLTPRSLLRVKVGDELNGFQLEEPLGAGAFGTTWRARATNQSDLKTLNLAEGGPWCDGFGATPCHLKVTIIVTTFTVWNIIYNSSFNTYALCLISNRKISKIENSRAYELTKRTQ